MKKGNRFLAVSLVVSMVLAGCAKSGGNETTASPAPTDAGETSAGAVEMTEPSYPIVEEKLTMTGLAWVSPQGGDNTSCYGWDEYEKLTNIHMEWENVPNDILAERKSTVMASNTLPDVFYALSFSNSDLTRYGSQGVFKPLDEMIDQHGYYFKKLMEEHPEIRKGITMPDGHIYGMPLLKLGDNMRVMKMYVNEDWLKNVGLDYPETLDEFTEMLVEFRDQDANGNGDSTDEIPLSFRQSHLIPTMMSFFNLGTRGSITHTLVDYDEKAQAVRFMPTAQEYKDMLTYLNMLYEEKLLDSEVFTMSSSRDIVAKLTQNMVGVHADYTTNAGELQDKYLALPLFKNYYGEKTWNRVLPIVELPGAFVVSATCKEPIAALKWVDYFYSEDGQIMSNMGFEGVTFEYDDSGEIKYTEEILNNPEGLTLTQARAKYMNFLSGPGVMSDEYYKGAETYPTSTEGLKYYIDAIPEEVWPAFNYTYEENEEISALQTDISAYVNEMTAAFITGKEDLGKWDSYVKEFDRLGLDRYMELVNTGYERYSTN